MSNLFEHCRTEISSASQRYEKPEAMQINLLFAEAKYSRCSQSAISLCQSAAGGGCGPHGAKRRRFPLPSRSDTLRGDKGERGCVWPPERHFTPHYPETAYEADRRRQRGRFPRGIKNAGFGHQSEPCGSLSAAGYLTSSNSTSSGCEESPAAEPAPAPASAPEAPAPALALALAFAPPCACCWA